MGILVSQTFWIAVQAIATAAAFIAILCQLKKAQEQIQILKDQIEVSRSTVRYDLLLRMDDRFTSAVAQSNRWKAAEMLKGALSRSVPKEFWNSDEAGTAVQDVLDILELMGALSRTGVVDKQDLWSLFSYYIVNYYLYCEKAQYFEGWLEDPTFYEEFKTLYREMQEISKTRKGEEDKINLTFLDQEISLSK
jgi:hypothetical protein